jgi:hypothetical protein
MAEATVRCDDEDLKIALFVLHIFACRQPRIRAGFA